MKFIIVLAFLLAPLMAEVPISAAGNLTEALEATISNGQVDYRALKEHESLLDQWLADGEKLNVESLESKDQMAFWINAYNVATLKLILMHHPVKSIKDIPVSKRWKWKGWTLAGKQVSLDGIEHEILRPMGDARIHFAINCASYSCPPLLPKLYQGKTLDADLDAVTRDFLKDENIGLKEEKQKSMWGWGGEEKKVFVSRLFQWFGEDFVKYEGSIVAFILKHSPKERVSAWKGMKDSDLSFLKYDWSLNGR